MSGLAIAGLAVSVGTTTMSFAQANKQKNLQKAAEQKANELLEDAKKRLDVNVYEALAIQKEPYELQREALLSQGASALQAGVEGSQRGAAATAGRVQMAQQAAQGGVRTAMGQEMMDLDKLVAAEDSRLLDVGMQVGLEESTDARQAARDAGNARQQALMQGIQGVGSVAQQAVAMAPLYSNNIKSQKDALMASPDVLQSMALNPFDVNNMSRKQFKSLPGYKFETNPQYIKNLGLIQGGSSSLQSEEMAKLLAEIEALKKQNN